MWKNNSPLKGQFTRVKKQAKIRLKSAVWRINNSQQKNNFSANHMYYLAFHMGNFPKCSVSHALPSYTSNFICVTFLQWALHIWYFLRMAFRLCYSSLCGFSCVLFYCTWFSCVTFLQVEVPYVSLSYKWLFIFVIFLHLVVHVCYFPTRGFS